MSIPYKPRRTPKRQAKRKLEGTKVERMVDKIISKHTKPHQKTKINRQKGIDIFVRDGIRLDVEVKSALEKTLYRYKDEHRYKMGRFTIKMSDYIDADLFAFVVKKVDKRNNKYYWNGLIDIYFIKAEVIRNYLKSRGLYKTSYNVKIGIRVIKSLPKTYLKSYFAYY